MKPPKHIITSLSIGAVIWFFTKSLYAGLLGFAGGIFVDSDHIIEYIIHYGWKGFDFKKIYDESDQTTKLETDAGFKKLYLIFHTAEIVLLLWAVSIYTKNIYLLSITVGYSSHLILDYIGNPVYPYSYFMFWRVLNGFEAERVIRKKTWKK